MNGREKILAALSPEGSAEIPVVICYEDLYIRDHWTQLSTRPWWESVSPDLAIQAAWRAEIAQTIGQDWLLLPDNLSHADRKRYVIQHDGTSAIWYDRLTQRRQSIDPPPPGGEHIPMKFDSSPQSFEEIDALLGNLPVPEIWLEEGNADLSQQILASWGATLFPIRHVTTPLWSCSRVWDYEQVMLMLYDSPQLIHHAVEKLAARSLNNIRIAALMGAKGIWIEDCLTDMVSPKLYRQFNLEYIRQMTAEIHHLGMYAIHYYCGNPTGKWNLLLDSGADALAFEESKKGFITDIAEIAGIVNGKMALLGNLDAVGVLENSTDEQLEAEISRQIKAGRANRSRFIMSLGSPVTPGTPASRVRRYCDLVHQINPSQ